MARSARARFDQAMRLDSEARATLMRPLIETLRGESEDGGDDAWPVVVAADDGLPSLRLAGSGQDQPESCRRC